jgi:hypothetical protein
MIFHGSNPSLEAPVGNGSGEVEAAPFLIQLVEVYTLANSTAREGCVCSAVQCSAVGECRPLASRSIIHIAY